MTRTGVQQKLTTEEKPVLERIAVQAGEKAAQVTDQASRLGDQATRLTNGLTDDGVRIGKAVMSGLEDQIDTAKLYIQRGRDAADDLMEDTTRRVREAPMQWVAASFGAGALLGAVISGIVLSRRN